MNNVFQVNRCFLMTLDPVHIGTGGYRLGRVDASIAREPGTRLPKIPGTSLHGAIRHYAAYRYEKNMKGSRKCSGQKDHCGRTECPICYTFGYAKGDEGGHAGVASISDARIILFPVYSHQGPVWVTTKNILEEAGFILGGYDSSVEAMTSLTTSGPLNLGWLMVETRNGVVVNLPEGVVYEEWPVIKDRIVVVKDKYFSRIVNSNLEVRTSVSINPQTGAAEDGALFTYEAIPRATFLFSDAVIDDYRNGELWSNGGIQSENQSNKRNTEEPVRAWTSPWDVVRAGLEWVEPLGIGGMGTRGFGRIRNVVDWEVGR